MNLFVMTEVLTDFQIDLISMYTNMHCFHCLKKIVDFQLPLRVQNIGDIIDPPHNNKKKPLYILKIIIVIKFKEVRWLDEALA